MSFWRLGLSDERLGFASRVETHRLLRIGILFGLAGQMTDSIRIVCFRATRIRFRAVDPAVRNRTHAWQVRSRTSPAASSAAPSLDRAADNRVYRRPNPLMLR